MPSSTLSHQQGNPMVHSYDSAEGIVAASDLASSVGAEEPAMDSIPEAAEEVLSAAGKGAKRLLSAALSDRAAVHPAFTGDRSLYGKGLDATPEWCAPAGKGLDAAQEWQAPARKV